MKNWRIAVGSLSSWSGWVIFAIALMRLILALTTDPNRTGNFSPLWLLLWAISMSAMITLVLLVMQLGFAKALSKKPRPLANLALVAVSGSVGNLTVGLLANNWGLDTEGLWHIRILGGAVMNLGVFFTVNTLVREVIARNESIRKLIETENQLLGYRDSAKQIIQDEVERLKQKTKDALLPAIDKIQELIATKSDQKQELLDELKQLISQDVRPLSKEVLQEAADLQQKSNPKDKNPKLKVTWVSKFNLKRSMRPIVAMPIFAAIFPMVEFLIIDHRSALRGLLGAVASALTLMLFKAITPKNLEVKTTSGIAIQVTMSALSIYPSYWIMYQEYGNTREVLIATAILIGIAVFGSFTLSYTKGVEIARERYEQSLNAYNAELAKEVALFEQKLSLEKRTWSSVIHGEVQSALSAAVARLQREEKLEPYHFEMIKQDLNRAKQNLLNPPKQTTSFTQAFSEIVLTWKSICTIQADISARAQRALDTNQDTRTVTNEIIKEAVSNAIRHGQAKDIQIKLDRIQDDILNIEIANDGFKPQRDAARGLGSQLLDELTLSWSLQNKNGKTTLEAQVPISKN